jgi:multimeric flavodoxin WrbA
MDQERDDQQCTENMSRRQLMKVTAAGLAVFAADNLSERIPEAFASTKAPETTMNVLLINGSPHGKGCTFTGLSEVAGALEKNGIKTRIIHTGTQVRDCMACNACAKTGYCVITDDGVNEAIDLLKKADGLVIGSPVHFAAPSASICAFMDRMFYLKEGPYALKPGAAVISCRRGGSSAAFDRLNKYFTFAAMPVASSLYWNSIHGFTPDDVKKDLEGLQTMRVLGNVMAWMIKSFTVAKANGVSGPEIEPKVFTHFIRS